MTTDPKYYDSDGMASVESAVKAARLLTEDADEEEAEWVIPADRAIEDDASSTSVGTGE